MDFDVNLVPCRWETVSDEVITPENFREQYLKCCDRLIDIAKSDFPKISELCSTVFNENSEQFQKYTWEAPKHLQQCEDIDDEYSVEGTAKDVLQRYIDEKWQSGGCKYENFIDLKEYGCLGVSTGCFSSRIWNENGKMRVTLELHTLYETGCYDHSLHNYGSLIIPDAKY